MPSTDDLEHLRRTLEWFEERWGRRPPTVVGVDVGPQPSVSVRHAVWRDADGAVHVNRIPPEAAPASGALDAERGPDGVWRVAPEGA